MSEDSAAGLNGQADGYINVGQDLVIWTTHFTVYVAYGNKTSGGGEGSTIVTPTVKSGAATSVTASSAVLNGSIDSDNGYDITDYGFLWGTDSDSLSNKLDAGTDKHSGAFSADLNNLTAETNYYFKAYAVNSKGTGYGSVLNFSTAPVSKPTPPNTPAVSKFSDVPSSYWASDAISSLSSKGIIAGYNDGTYRPEALVTRAEFVTMLTKALGLKTTGVSAQFTDVAANSWCGSAISAAVAAGLASGTGNQQFSPDAAITREQMAVMAARALGNKAPVVEGTELNDFQDRSRVDSWAESGIEEAVKAGIMSGMSKDDLSPQTSVTRAQAAAIIQKLLNVLNK